MTDQPIEVARNQWGAVLHHPDTHTLELKWFASTREMTDNDFKATLELFASQAERLQPITSGLIDATEFFHSFADGAALAWRDEHIIPRYNAVGMTRFAFHVPAASPTTIEAGGGPAVEGQAVFPTAWFSTRKRATAWLAEPR
jgi:hypothetical protein